MNGEVFAMRFLFLILIIEEILLFQKGYRQSPINITSDIMMRCEAVSMNLYLNNSNNELQFALHKTHFIVTFSYGNKNLVLLDNLYK